MFTPKRPPPVGVGVTFVLLIFWAVHFPDFFIFDPLKSPWGGWVNLFWARMIPASIRMRAKFGWSQTVVSKMGVQTHTRTHTQRDTAA